MVDKFLKSNDKPAAERQANGAVQEISENTTMESTSLAVENESMIYFLGRKFVEVKILYIYDFGFLLKKGSFCVYLERAV